MKHQIFNFEFPSWCDQITIYGYRFTRLEDYENRLSKLQHLSSIHAEFQILVNTGEHSATSSIEYPKREPKAVLEWVEGNSTALNDILLLLTIFTGRDVFVIIEDINKIAILRDPRIYQWGGILRASIKYKGVSIDDSNDVSKHLAMEYNIGFEEGINGIYQLMRGNDWRKEYKGGYYLFLARQAFRTRSLESAFIQCWTIWEHLFTVHNLNWLSDEKIHQLSSYEKISYILVRYGLKGEIDKKSRKRIKDWSDIRNRLVHYGRFPKPEDTNNAEFFIRLTEFVIVKTLGLIPSEVFDTTKRLEKFLKGQLEPR